MNRYQIEIDEFIDKFGNSKPARIILYGIGRYTATLVEGLQDFHFVGLMDKDPSNVGKTMFGLPIVDKHTAEEIADMVVINTSETYWDVIYSRIQDLKIPVFYKNGKKAEKKDNIKLENPYRDLSYEDLCEEIKAAEVVSFDFFDTLFMRSVSNPRDIFRLLEIEMAEVDARLIRLTELREEAKKEIKVNYSLDDLYAKMESISGLPHSLLEDAKNRELEIEGRQLIPRKAAVDALRLALELGKDVYIVSDMYLTEKFYRSVLNQYGIELPVGHILVSNALDMSKADGTIWRYYADSIVKGRSALHVGDHHQADIEEPVKYGIKAYQTPKAWDLLGASSMRESASRAYTDYALAVVGCILKELFENPFALEHTDGRIRIRTNYEMGYYVFGSVILTFLLWLLQRSEEDQVGKLIFMSRDGYFLKEDFEYLCTQIGVPKECCYLGISRQLAMMASAESKAELMEYMSMPYTGSITELFEDRLGIEDVKEVPGQPLEGYIEGYQSEIEDRVRNVRGNYLYYLKQMGLDDRCAVVDLGYYGNNQRYLNKLLQRKMAGYYFNVNLSGQNKNTAVQKMTGCFQMEDDLTGENSQILKKMIYLESFLTAPYGMVKAVDADGRFVCAERKKNQEHFQDKEEMNQGVKQFIHDYWKVFGQVGFQPDLEFIDWYYGYCFGGAVEFSEGVKGSFYNDNAMMNRIESMLFY